MLFPLVAMVSAQAAEQASVTFTRLIVKDEEGKILGASTENYRSQILQRMKAAGLNVKGADDAMFGNGESATADYLLGGTLTAVAARDLAPYGVEVAVEWKLLERTSNAVVYTVVTRGYAEGKSAQDGDAGLAALNDALDRALGRQHFHEALSQSASTTQLPPAVWDAPLRVRACKRNNLNLPTEMKKALDGVVVVKAGDAIGSGAMISPDGFVVTAAHVIGAEAAPTVRTRAGIELKAAVVRVDEAQDVAILHVSGTKNACLPIEVGPPEQGSELYTVGAPAGLDFSVSKGVVSNLRQLEGFTYLQTDAAINPGASGGPMMDRYGRPVAIVSWKIAAPGFEGLGFGVPVAAVVARLGLDYGEDSDTDLTTLAGRITRPAPAAEGGFVDEADAPRLQPVTTAERHAVKAKKHRSSGIVMTSIGLAAVAGTGIWALTADHASDPVWTAATVGNVGGWLLLAGGAANIGVSLLPGPRETALAGPVTVGLSGQF